MKKTLQYLMLLIFASPLFFACNTARNYEFANRSESYHSQKTVVTPGDNEKAANLPGLISDEQLTASTTETIAPMAAKPLVDLQVTEKQQTPVANMLATPENLTVTKAQKKELIKTLKKIKKEQKSQDVQAGKPTVDIAELILAIIIPPVGVLLHDSGLSTRFWISLLLTLLFFFPGMIYAVLVVTDTI